MTSRKNAPSGRRGKQAQVELTAALNPDVPLFPYAAGLSDEEKFYWLEMVNSQVDGFFTRGDIMLLKMYCRCAADVDRLTTDIKEEGETIQNDRGTVQMNPKVSARNFAEQRLMSLSTKLRAQPQSRTTIRGTEGKQKRKSAAKAAAEIIAGDEDDLLAGGPLGPMQ